MVRSSCVLLGTCALAWAIAACSSGGGTDSTAGPPAGGSDSGAADGAADASPTDSASGATDSAASDGAGANDAAAPAPPACHAGDRKEWSGPIPSTALAVAVCSLCGESYVVASNGSASPAQVSVANGSTTITAAVPANGTATTANLADNPADGTVTVCGTSGSHGCLAAATPNQRYCDPYRAITGLRAERIDQGVDYGGSGPIYAMGPGTIDLYKNRNDTGWPGGTFASYKVSVGPAAGRIVYLAENIDLNPALGTGSFVYGGTVLGTLVNASPDSESGWGVAGAGYTAEHSCYVEACDTPLGDNFNQLLVCLHATPGVPGTGGCCTMPSGWPADWCTVLATWQ
ncbi:MAG TPA: hypothetical protein VIF09_11220 [Polyangiaceae bacterium]